MILHNKIKRFFCGHRIFLLGFLCLFGICIVYSHIAQVKKRRHVDNRVYLIHADELYFDEFKMPGVQIVKGKVAFRHQGAKLTCDSAYFRQDDNTFEAFGHVRMTQGDTLSLTSEYAYYDGREQMVRARHKVILRHRRSVLYCDSLDYDRKFNFGYFFEGGKLVDNKNTLVADWGEYNTETRNATFYYGVRLKSTDYDIHTDTLHYDTRTSLANIVGPSTIYNKGNIIKTSKGFYDTKNDKTKLFGRSTVTSKDKTREITGDSLFYNSKSGISEGYGNVIYVDTKNKNKLTGGYCYYNEKSGDALATRNPVVMDFSQQDTLYMHSDTIRMKTYYINTDSMYRKTYCYNKVRAYHINIQAVCDSLVFNTKDSCMTMYKDPIAWNGDRQLLGEEIRVYMNDSTINRAHVRGQASSIELMFDKKHYNQLYSNDMFAYFEEGKLRRTDAIGNVLAVYYPIDEKDSSLIALDYTETDTMRMYMSDERKLQKIWTSKAEGTWFPISQIPHEKEKLSGFAWFDYIRPVDKDDIFEWRGKESGMEIKPLQRSSAPLQILDDKDNVVL